MSRPPRPASSSGATGVPFAAFRCELLTDANELERALDVALAVERLQRGAGIEVLPAARASLLARLGRCEDALAAVADVIARLERVHPAERPHGDLADALAALGRSDEAAVHALQAYRRAWADGPPYSFHWDLRDARERLKRLGVAIPELPTVDPDTVRIPLEDEIRAYIAALEASGGRAYLGVTPPAEVLHSPACRPRDRASRSRRPTT